MKKAARGYRTAFHEKKENRSACLSLPLHIGSGAGFFAIIADRIDGASLQSLHAEIDLLLSLGLVVDEGIPAIIVASEKCGGGFAAKIAVDALLIDIETPTNILFPFFGFICHRGTIFRI